MKRLRLYLVLATVASVMVGACSSSTAQGSTHRVLTYAYARQFSNLDPSESDAAENDVFVNVFETLATYDPKTQQAKPLLATSWDHNSDGTEWTFHLRPGVKFQDGSPFDANAVKFSIQRTAKLNQGAGYIWAPVTEIDVVNSLTVTLKLSQAQPMDLIAASGWGAFMMTPTADDQDPSWFNQGRGVGTGPYEYGSYTPGQSMTLKPFQGYWGGWKSDQFTDIVYNFAPDATTREQLLRSHQAIMALNVSRPDLTSLSQSFAIHPVDTMDAAEVILNVKRAPTNNVLVRKAMLYAFPEDQIASDVFHQYAPKIRDFAPNSLWGTDAPLTGYNLDLTMAKQLLAQAGYPNGGLTVEYTSTTDAYPEEERVGELWKASLAQIGITMNIRNITFNQNVQISTQTDPNAAPNASILEWVPNIPSLQDYLFNSFGSQAGFHKAYYSNSDFDTLVNDGGVLSATDRKAAAAKFQQASQMILDQAVGLPMVDNADIWVADKNVSGFVATPFGLLLHDLYVTS